jgi:hypothetical protein
MVDHCIQRSVEVVRTVPLGLAGLLTRVAGPAQVEVEQPWNELLAPHRKDRREANEELASGMLRAEEDGARDDLGFEDRRNRLRSTWQTASNPVELWSVHCRR